MAALTSLDKVFGLTPPARASLLTNLLNVSILPGGSQMDILKALRIEEKKIEKRAKSAAQNLETVRASIKVFAGKVDRRRRTMSKAAKAKISAAQKSRWAKWAKAKAK
jgi:hypothetical protein